MSKLIYPFQETIKGGLKRADNFIVRSFFLFLTSFYFFKMITSRKEKMSEEKKSKNDVKRMLN